MLKARYWPLISSHLLFSCSKLISWRQQFSQANMRFQIAVSVFSICMAIAKFSWSFDEGQKFYRVESDNGEVLCGMSPPNTTLNDVRSPLECVSLCRQGCASLCQSINYRKNAKLCEQFDYRPCSYAIQPDCTNYQVMTDVNVYWYVHKKYVLWNMVSAP